MVFEFNGVNMAAPCSVKAMGLYRAPPHWGELEVTNCDLKFADSWCVSSNIKSEGKRAIFLLTACLSAFVETPYRSAKSWSSMIFCPRTKRIAYSIFSVAILIAFSLIGRSPPSIRIQQIFTYLSPSPSSYNHPLLYDTDSFFRSVHEVKDFKIGF